MVEAVCGILLAAILAGAYLWSTRSDSDSQSVRLWAHPPARSGSNTVTPAPVYSTTRPIAAPAFNGSSSGSQTEQRSTAAVAVASAPPVDALADAVRLAPGASGDPISGARVFPGRNRGAFAKLGLHPGDVITSLDGVPVTAEQLKNLQGLLMNGGAATATVFRAGREQQITLHPVD